jgi:hypothetical protein
MMLGPSTARRAIGAFLTGALPLVLAFSCAFALLIGGIVVSGVISEFIHHEPIPPKSALWGLVIGPCLLALSAWLFSVLRRRLST